MRASDFERVKKLEATYRGHVIEESLRNAADAVALRVGTGTPNALRKGAGQFPFESVLQKQGVRLEIRYRRVLEASPDAVVVINERREMVLFNLRAERLFGYTREELLDQAAETIVPRGLNEHLLLLQAGSQIAPDRMTPQMNAPIDLIGRRKDGSEFPLEVTLSPFAGPEGPLAIASIRDVTSKAAAIRRMSLDLAKFRALVEALPDAMIVANKRGKIVLVNSQAEIQFGYARGELLGLKVTTLLREDFTESPVTETGSDDALAIASQSEALIESVGHRKDGTEFPIEIALGWSEAAEGPLAIAAVRDITQRKVADQTLVEMEAQYRGLFDAAPDAMIVLEQDGTIRLVNEQAEAAFGYRQDELARLPVQKIVPLGLAERAATGNFRSLEDTLAHQTGLGIELVGRRKAGNTFPIEVMLSRIETPDRALVTASIRDITVRKGAEKHPSKS